MVAAGRAQRLDQDGLAERAGKLAERPLMFARLIRQTKKTTTKITNIMLPVRHHQESWPSMQLVTHENR